RSAHEAAQRGQFDVVWFPWNGLRFPCAAPTLVTMYDTFAFSDPERDPIARHRVRAPMRRAAKRATRLATISQWSRAQIVATLGVAPERIDVISPAPDPFWTPGEGNAPPPGIRAGRYVLLVGAREPRKNAVLLVEACARSLREDEALVVAGELPGIEHISALLHGLNLVVLSADDRELRSLYRNAGVVAIPSTAEGFGLVALEAMACGAPVIASDSAALPEATAGGALLLDPHDVERWAAELRTVLDDAAASAELRARGLARVADLDRGGYARETLALLRRLAGS
ncbi:MAG TPA: glycosyltransferase family 1 protein, partial [Candidatus Baltobacteraceae bacterium]|nr:glycosyltransferase family 1 protein [Candidatus Baltobacteraceae bacterium]